MHLILGTVKKCGLFKIAHEKFKQEKKFHAEFQEFKETLESAIAHHKEMVPYINKAQVESSWFLF